MGGGFYKENKIEFNFPEIDNLNIDLPIINDEYCYTLYHLEKIFKLDKSNICRYMKRINFIPKKRYVNNGKNQRQLTFVFKKEDILFLWNKRNEVI